MEEGDDEGGIPARRREEQVWRSGDEGVTWGLYSTASWVCNIRL